MVRRLVRIIREVEKMMKLYGFGPTRSLRALWGLKELDADFDFVPVNVAAGEQKQKGRKTSLSLVHGAPFRLCVT